MDDIATSMLEKTLDLPLVAHSLQVSLFPVRRRESYSYRRGTSTYSKGLRFHKNPATQNVAMEASQHILASFTRRHVHLKPSAGFGLLSSHDLLFLLIAAAEVHQGAALSLPASLVSSAVVLDFTQHLEITLFRIDKYLAAQTRASIDITPPSIADRQKTTRVCNL